VCVPEPAHVREIAGGVGNTIRALLANVMAEVGLLCNRMKLTARFCSVELYAKGRLSFHPIPCGSRDCTDINHVK